MSEKAANAQCQTPIPTRKRGWVPGSVTPNVYSAAKRRRMSLADEDSADFEGFGTDFGSTSKVDVVRVYLSAVILLSIRRSAGCGCGHTGRCVRLQVARDRVCVSTCLTTCGLPETLLRRKVSVACIIFRQVVSKRWSAMSGNLPYFDRAVGCWRMGTIVSLSSVGNAMPDGWPDVAGTRAGSLLLSLMRSERKRGVHGRTHSVGR